MKKLFVILASVILAVSLFACDKTDKKKEPPVITGVKSSITVYADDTDEVLRSAFLDGVSAVGEDSCEVKVAIISATDGSEVTELVAGEYILRYYCDDPEAEVVTSALTVKPADTTPPEITGTKDLVVYLGDSVSFREGVSVSDNDDLSVSFSVDASGVDLTRLGKYEVTYTATDKRGNTASVTVKVSVLAPLENSSQNSSVCTAEEFNQLCKDILDDILEEGMTEREIAEAIYNRVSKIKYANTYDDPNWMVNAWKGLTTNKGDCVNYAAASKALLTMAGIPNYDVRRVGGTSDHFWQIVCVDGVWYHFDACPTLRAKPFRCFLRTESEVAAYTALRTDKPNYYVYDKENCPYDVAE